MTDEKDADKYHLKLKLNIDIIKLRGKYNRASNKKSYKQKQCLTQRKL
jgi:hypothetical protein